MREHKQTMLARTGIITVHMQFEGQHGGGNAMEVLHVAAKELY